MGAAKEDKINVIVVGAGPSGLLLALLLAKQGMEVTVLEKSSEYDKQPRASFYSLPAIHEMKRAGIYEEVSERAFHANGVSWRYIDGTRIASIRADEAAPEAKMVSLPLDELIRGRCKPLCMKMDPALLQRHLHPRRVHDLHGTSIGGGRADISTPLPYHLYQGYYMQAGSARSFAADGP
ncbi:hypothetical protein LTR91_020266 [Friedmanniomyces endolithicus]|uniref:FAD-binding domain-containing protein n=1 Tax=Friedmanniomyces endolithicus TaxID=329885 RepID=A0AAN6HEE7_9PEZI|nr:hypothetical protein LTR57_005271 [Friedmanniomyces endolithicus]KAK0960646.1 hypothetical protein LTR91_020266 [Friedmanniomyces endolithicus]KAK1045827.1 hypothetical protein LTS16_006253 [Friedmanniomyces endolithicus]